MRMRNFHPDEFSCKGKDCGCGGRNECTSDLYAMIDEAREYAGVPFVITSGYRCEKHNAFVGGKQSSAHMRGQAADIQVTNSHARWNIIYGLYMAGFRRIGVAESFVHVDIDQTKVQRTMWTY